MQAPARLTFVVAAAIVPAALVAILLIGYDYYHRQRDRLVRDSMGTARALVAAVDTELTGVKAALLALATSPYLSSDDLASFHGQAQAALMGQGFANIVIIDERGRQLVNTLRRHGEPLPAEGNPPQLQRIFQTGEAVITDLFVGPVVKRHYIAVERQRLPPGWIGVILDGQGTIVARTHDAARLVGQKGSELLVRRMRGFIALLTALGLALLISRRILR
jgi:hypothetical protein